MAKGELDPDTRAEVDEGLAELRRFTHDHADEIFSKPAPEAPDATMRDAVLATAYLLSCGDARYTKELYALARTLPGNSQPHWSAGDRAVFAWTQADVALRCRKEMPDRIDSQRITSDVAVFTRLAGKHPLLWDELGLKNTPPPGGWGEAGPPSLTPFLERCSVPKFWRLISDQTGISVGVYSH